MEQNFKHLCKVDQLDLLVKVAENPEEYCNDEHLRPLAEEFMEVVEKEEYTAYKLEEKPKKAKCPTSDKKQNARTNKKV